MVSIVNLSMDKNVDDVLRKSQMDKNVEDILSKSSMDKNVDGKSQDGQKRRGYPQ